MGIGFFTGLAIFLNLIYGIVFTPEEQKQWMLVTHLTIAFEIVIYTPLTVVLKWLLPPYLTECIFLIFFVVIIIFAVHCQDILDTERRNWSDNVNLFCEILPV